MKTLQRRIGLVRAVGALLGVAHIPACADGPDPAAPTTMTRAARSMAIVAGNNQTAVVGQSLAQPLAVRVAGDGGAPVAGAPVSWNVASGAGSITPTSTTNADGVATAEWTLGVRAGAGSVSAIPASGGAAAVRFDAMAMPDVPVRAVPVGGMNQTGRAGEALGEEVAVRVTDRFDNAVPTAAVSWAVDSGGGTVAPSAATTGSDGVARAEWTMGDDTGIENQFLSVRLAASPAAAATFVASAARYSLCIAVDDPVGDHNGNVDVRKLIVSFDDESGAYEALVASTTQHLFRATFRININLYNQDHGAPHRDSSFFTSNFNDFDFGPGSTALLRISGEHLALRGWAAGHRVFTNSLAGTGNPDGVTLYRSGAADLVDGQLASGREDVIAFTNLSQPAVVVRIR
jgi:hypothetical protein